MLIHINDDNPVLHLRIAAGVCAHAHVDAHDMVEQRSRYHSMLTIMSD